MFCCVREDHCCSVRDGTRNYAWDGQLNDSGVQDSILTPRGAALLDQIEDGTQIITPGRVVSCPAHVWAVRVEPNVTGRDPVSIAPSRVGAYMAMRGATDVYRRFLRALSRVPSDRHGVWREWDLWMLHAQHVEEFNARCIEVFLCALGVEREEYGNDFVKRYERPMAWYRVVSSEDIAVRRGTPFSSPVMRRLPTGSVVEVFERLEANCRDEPSALLRTADGWVSDRCPLLGEVVLEELPASQGLQRLTATVSPVQSLIAAQKRRFKGDCPRSFDGFWEDAGELDGEITAIKGSRMRSSDGVIRRIRIPDEDHIQVELDGAMYVGEMLADASISWSWGGVWVRYIPSDNDFPAPPLSRSRHLSKVQLAAPEGNCFTKWVTFVDAKGARGFLPECALMPPANRGKSPPPRARRRVVFQDEPDTLEAAALGAAADETDDMCSVM